MNPIDKLKFEDLPEFSIFRDIWVSIGEVAFKKFISDFTGLNIYIPKINSFDKLILRVIRDEKINDARIVSNMFNISRRTAKNYIKNAISFDLTKNQTDNNLILNMIDNEKNKIISKNNLLKDYF